MSRKELERLQRLRGISDMAGRLIEHHAHAKDVAWISQGSIVENKQLDAVLGWIAERQRERDVQRLTNRKITLRTKTGIRPTAGLTA